MTTGTLALIRWRKNLILTLEGTLSYKCTLAVIFWWKNVLIWQRGERNAIYLLRYDASIKIKEVEKGSAVVVWYREDYLRESNSQLKDNDVYRKLKGDGKILS